MVRFLYRADIQEMADYLNQRPDLIDFGVTGLLAGPWDKLALAIDLGDERATTARPRWYNPERAILVEPPLSFFTPFPTIPSTYADHYRPVSGEGHAGSYTLNQVVTDLNMTPSVCFQNGLCLLTADYDPERQRLEVGWLVKRRLDLPSMPLISNPPPPGVYAGPRLLVFVQLQDAAGNFLLGDDGLWVDPATLQAGDVFLQQHWLAPAGNSLQDKEATVVVFGLYDPMNGERILTEDGRNHLRLEIGG
jgi:hypothetical protein